MFCCFRSLQIFANVCKLGVIFAFIVYTAIDQAQANNAPVMNLMIVLPFLMLGSSIFLFVGTVEKAGELNKETIEADDAWSSCEHQKEFACSVYFEGVVVLLRPCLNSCLLYK